MMQSRLVVLTLLLDTSIDFNSVIIIVIIITCSRPVPVNLFSLLADLTSARHQRLQAMLLEMHASRVRAI